MDLTTLSEGALRGRLADLRSQATTLSARLSGPDATDHDVADAQEVAESIRAVTAELQRREASSNAASAQARRDALANRSTDHSRSTGTTTSLRENTMRTTNPARALTDSSNFRAFRDNGFRGTASIEVDTRALLTVPGAGGSTGRTPEIVRDVPDRPIRIADLLDRRTTDTGEIEYVVDGSGDTSAAEVAEGSVKPESTMTFTVEKTPTVTIAHWVNITRQTAEDASQVVAYVEGRLVTGLERRLDAQALNGDGVGPNMTGILSTGGINTYAPAAAEDRLISVRKAITPVQIDEHTPQAVVLHPSDWEVIELDTDNNGAFRVSPNVQSITMPRLWGLTVVVSAAIAAGIALVGAFREGATLWERQSAALLVSDSHASNFTSNILTLLAEMRVGLTVWRPSAFCRVTFNGMT